MNLQDWDQQPRKSKLASFLHKPLGRQVLSIEGAKPKTKKGYFILGLLPIPITLLLSYAMVMATAFCGFDTPDESCLSARVIYTNLANAILVIIALAFFAFIFLLVKSKRSGRIRLWSFAKGVLWSYSIVWLLILFIIVDPRIIL